MLRKLFNRLWGPSPAALAYAHEQAEIARLKGIANEPPPAGNGWRVGDMDSEGKWTVWNGPARIAAFYDADTATAWARAQNTDKPTGKPIQRDDGKYCVNCGSTETDASVKARCYHSCCPERQIIPQLWHVSDGPLATGKWHLWQPGAGLESLERHGWGDMQGARLECDRRNLLADKKEREAADPKAAAAALAAFLDVPIPAGVVAVVGPLRSPTDGLWWVFTTAGPRKGYFNRTKAGAYAKRLNRAAAQRGTAQA